MNEEASGRWRPLTRAEAVAHGWTLSDHEGCGTVTRAFDEWYFIDKDQRAFLHQTLRWAQERFDAEWQAVMELPAGEDGSDPIDVFYNRVGGLMPHDYEWMTLSAVVRDAVTAYEVYLGTAVDEVLRAHGKRRKQRPDRTPSRKQLSPHLELLGLEESTAQVQETVALRNILTHQRGMLRREEDRRRYASGENAFGAGVAHLTTENVVKHMDLLAATVHTLDPVLWVYSWGTRRVPDLADRLG